MPELATPSSWQPSNGPGRDIKVFLAPHECVEKSGDFSWCKEPVSNPFDIGSEVIC